MQSVDPSTDAVNRMLTRVSQLTHLRITARNRADLERVAQSRARALGLSLDEWVAHLDDVSSPRELEHIVRELTVGETYLFRGPVFRVIEECVLPELVERRRREGSRVLRIASAGCATGEEAYSLAILALEAIGDVTGWHVSVLGLDVNTAFLERAEGACYGSWSTRDVAPEVLERHFERESDQWRVKSDVRSLVRFQYANLAFDPLPAPALGVLGMDLVLCQNVLYYFEPQARDRVITSLSHALSPEGFLFFGPADLVSAEIPICRTESYGDVTAYRRMGRFSAAPRRRPALPSLGPPPDSPPPHSETPSSSDESSDGEAFAPPHFALALALADDGDVVGAIGELEAFLDAQRDHASGHSLHGFLLAEVGEPERALDAFRRAIYLDAKSLLAHMGALTVARRLGRLELTRRFESRVRALAASQPRHAKIAGWNGMTVGRLLALFRDDAEDGG